jgi:phenylalanyl-tRNA synthetase beta chain
MKFTLAWLKDHLDTQESLEQLTERLTKLGLEVESVVNPGAQLKGFKVAHILEAKPHPEADRLQVCTVECGEPAPLQIVCGAPNARAGLKVVLGLPGAHVPGLDVTLKVSKIRGVESFGMLCSSKELGIGDGHETGILELEEAAPVGMDFADYADLNDPVVEVSVTPNRPDCLGVRGIARDLAAAGAGTLKPLETPIIKGHFKAPLEIHLTHDAQKACPQYMGRVIRYVQNRPSPDWLQKRLKAVGLKPISALVDITNYISFDLCRPLHAFDLRAIHGNMEVRFARPHETFQALDHKDYTLGDEMLVIADQEKVLAIGGVMGGLESGCTLETESILLESAYFDPLVVASAGRALNLHSDSRYRFERGIDPLSARMGIEKATQMILDICGGEASDLIELGKGEFSIEWSQPHIPFHVSMVTKRTGIEITEEKAHSILERLGFLLMKETSVVVPPSWRPDVTISEDVVEEVARIYGYDHLPEISLPQRAPSTLMHRQALTVQIRHLLASRRFMEAVTWSMVSQQQFHLFGGAHEELRIMNPITVDLEYLRPSVLIHLLKSLQQNLDRGLSPLSFFEIGPRYKMLSIPSEGTFVDQISTIAGVRVGKEKAYHWSKQERALDVFDIKADVWAVFELAGLKPDQLEIVTEGLPSWYHPGRAGWIRYRKETIGIFGELHPFLLKEFDIKDPVFAFEIDLPGLLLGKKKTKSSLSLSPFQKVERDFCFLFDKSVRADRILATLNNIDASVQEVKIFDVYEGMGVPEGQKSISIHMVFEPKERTFAEAEVKTLYDQVVAAVETQLQGSLRL